ncbi:ATP-binding protein [Novispirillum itersonii]|uniref:histidine kinase n=1 Tax=Novispirillum itersonii TaxID=189 RepID=A0A7W9ZH90_NOVIT|nr:ATP-binding protein [Novispirillum itersonii]MBB6211033.1 PAS domain S-box-containing protein [Novispirillum itersonii]
MQGSQTRPIILTALVCLATLWILAVLDGINNYFIIRRAAETRIMASARIIETRLVQVLRQTELFIDDLALAERFPETPTAVSPPARPAETTPRAHLPEESVLTSLRGQLEQDAILRGKPQNLTVVNRSGKIVRATSAGLIGQDVSHRYYFRAIADHPARDTLVIGEVIRSPLGGYIFVASKGFWRTENQLDFAVTASLPQTMLTEILRSSLTESGSERVALSNTNHDLLARFPDPPENPVGEKRLSPALKEFIASGAREAVLDAPSGADGEARIFALRRTQPYGVDITVSLPLREVLRPWFRQLAVVVTISGLLTALILFITRQAITREISRSRAEIRLRETESELSRAQKLARIGSWRPTPDGSAILLSDQMYSLLDLKPGTRMTQEQLADYIHPDDRLDVRAAYERASDGTAVDLIHRIVTPCGQRWVRQHGELLFDGNGVAVSGVCTLQDITRLKQAEELILQSRDHYLRLLETFPSLVWRSVSDGLPRYFNQTWLDFTGRTLEQEQNGGWLGGIHDDDLALVRDTLGSHLARKLPFTVEFRLRRADGEYRWLRCIAHPFTDMDGTFAGYIGAGFDITEQRQLLENLERSNAELEQFAYIASHDLREPLRMISSYLNLIERRLGPGMDPELAEFFGYARDGAQRMNRLILDVLEFSRVGRLSTPPRPVEMAAPVRQAITDLGPLVTDSGARIIVQAPLPGVQGNEEELIRLFQNLLSNAIQYRSPDRVPEITVSCQPGRHAHQFSVRDNGIGIPPDQFDRIFRIFQRLHGRETKAGSSGIGLAICKKIVEFHGGKIWAESDGTETGGTTFHFTLPAAAEDFAA